ncbi:oxidoreductase [Lentzea sp. NBRC 105346]|uniref:FAD-binding oxidoreductase n=1 Tax=Lentzea sp. NBRC 105346 TaxID=3032205 RepID=UPI0024A552B2|nr:FAD-binding oxidoreductase [Lentzea sp. NBRC 105346]GLZ30055.1 oxidoreductase [Lentzea sp. NBRC 105346]
METFFPGDQGYDDERGGFQTAFRHRPEVIFGVESADDVRKAVQYATDHDLAVTVQATGHGTQHEQSGVLITTKRMTGVRIDPATRTARVEAGALWRHVIEAAAPHGLAPLSGSSPDVGVIGYTLGGGIGLLAREFGYAKDRVRNVEKIGDVITAIEIDLLPIERIFGGTMHFPRSREVLDTFLRWTEAAPETVTTSLGIVGDTMHVRFASTKELDLSAWRGATVNTVRWMPFTESGTVYNDPTTPHGYYGDSVLVSELDPEVILGPAPVFTIVDIRHMGGALGGPGKYLLRLISPVDDNVSEVDAHHRNVFARVQPVGHEPTFTYGPH